MVTATSITHGKPVKNSVSSLPLNQSIPHTPSLRDIISTPKRKNGCSSQAEKAPKEGKRLRGLYSFSEKFRDATVIFSARPSAGTSGFAPPKENGKKSPLPNLVMMEPENPTDSIATWERQTGNSSSPRGDFPKDSPSLEIHSSANPASALRPQCCFPSSPGSSSKDFLGAIFPEDIAPSIEALTT